MSSPVATIRAGEPIRSTERFGWYLFDSATSVLFYSGGLYFPQWLVEMKPHGDVAFNLSLVGITVLLFAIGPYLGRLSDLRWGRKRFLSLSVLAMFLESLGLAFTAMHRPVPIYLSLLLFASVLLTYQLSLIFYNSLLVRVARWEDIPAVSGKGLIWGWIGGLVGVAIVQFVVDGKVPGFQAGHAGAFLPTALIFGLIALISLLLIPDDKSHSTDSHLVAQTESVKRALMKQVWRAVRNPRSTNDQAAVFLIAYFLYTDGILTVENNATVFLSEGVHLSDHTKLWLYVLLMVVASLGSIASGIAARRLGTSKTLIITIIGWALFLIMLGFKTGLSTFIVLFAGIGFLFGSVLNVSRVCYLRIIPDDKRAEYFGFYCTCERMASVFGPLAWAATLIILSHSGETRYRIAMVVMGLVVSSSLFYLRCVEEVPI